MKNYFANKLNFTKLLLLLLTVAFVSCDDDDTVVTMPEPWAAPETYTFERDGVSTISFGGQTTRLSQSNELYDALNSTDATVESLTLMFAGDSDGKSAGFDDTSLNGTSKLIRSKTSASSISGSSAVKELFDNWITEYVNDVIPNVKIATDASVGQAGIYGKYAFNTKGHEIDQLFFKGLIGAFTLDQIINNYIDAAYLESYKADNDAGVISGSSAPYTTMEHKWDEGFGYLYGHVIDGVAEDLPTAGTSPSGKGNLLMKYFKKVNDSKDTEIALDVYNAFIMGRAAIVNKDYTVMEAQSKILKQKLSTVIGHYALNYLSGAIADIGTNVGDARLDAFHGLSLIHI